jgi:hypothetical protein
LGLRLHPSASFAASRTGRGLRIPCGAARVVPFMWSPRAIRTL